MFLLCVCVCFRIVSESELHKRLCTESVLLIRREDVLQRLSLPCHQFNLSEGFEDPRWKTMDVEGGLKRRFAIFKDRPTNPNRLSNMRRDKYDDRGVP